MLVAIDQHEAKETFFSSGKLGELMGCHFLKGNHEPGIGQYLFMVNYSFPFEE